MKRLLPVLAAVLAVMSTSTAHGAVPGITGPTFNLTAQDAYITQPDGVSIYSWGYGCDPKSPVPGFLPSAIREATCNAMQIPGPTLIVTEGQTVTVKLTNNLPAAAGNTSILFPGFNVCVGNLTGASATSAGTCKPVAAAAGNGVPGLLTQEAAPGASVTYSFFAGSPGTRSYYSGTEGDLQVEMGLYGAVIVLPIGNADVTAACGTLTSGGLPATNPGGNRAARLNWNESDYRLAAAAYDQAATCYDREYLFQWSEMDPRIHQRAEAQVAATAGCVAGSSGCSLNIATEPYRPSYFLINGRSMPDDMDANYASQYPHQPYNGNPHMHPGEVTLLRIIGQGRWQHPFHEHANHVRIIARDGNLLVSQSDPTLLAGPALFTTTTTPGMAMDGLFTYTGKGLNWDMFGHNPASTDGSAKLACIPDVNGYNTGISATKAINYFEWCQDHNKPLQSTPIGDVAAAGPATLPDPNILTNGAWYGGSPYFGPEATQRAVSSTGTTPPAGTVVNSPTTEAGFAFMWHSHNEREITTNNAFPGGMMMMMIVDSREFPIDESK